MRRVLTRALCALAFTLLPGTAAWAQAPAFFYCYAPDPATGTVHMSQALPVGPISERAGYGGAFAAYLKSSGKVGGDVQAYCTMRATEADIAKGQAMLPQEPCPECGGARNFTRVTWARAAPPRPASPTRIAAPPARTTGPQATPTLPRQPPANRPAAIPANASDPWLVVMGNRETGQLLKRSNQRDLVRITEAAARAIRPSGWTTLLATRQPGYGAAMCIRHAGEVRFFVAHGKATVKEAFQAAQAEIRPFAGEVKQTTFSCGAPWRAEPGVDAPRERSVIDAGKDVIRRKVSCDPRLPPTAPAGADGRGPCPISENGAIGVRG